jgi:hypothetical protein
VTLADIVLEAGWPAKTPPAEPGNQESIGRS